MKSFRLLSLALVACACAAANATLPEFSLSDGASEGHLTWLGHSTDIHAPIKPDAVLEIPAENVVSIGLHWSTEPVSEECLITYGMWRVPKNILAAPSYVISAERLSAEEIVFTLSETGGVVLLRSPSFHLEKVVLRSASEIKKIFGETHPVRHHKPPARR